MFRKETSAGERLASLVHKTMRLEDVSKGVCVEREEKRDRSQPWLCRGKRLGREEGSALDTELKRQTSETEENQAEVRLWGPWENGLREGGVMGTVGLR